MDSWPVVILRLVLTRRWRDTMLALRRRHWSPGETCWCNSAPDWCLADGCRNSAPRGRQFCESCSRKLTDPAALAAALELDLCDRLTRVQHTIPLAVLAIAIDLDDAARDGVPGRDTMRVALAEIVSLAETYAANPSMDMPP